MRIDSHHHLWICSAEEYGCIDDRIQALGRDILLEAQEVELTAACVEMTVVVQARQTLEETRWPLQITSGARKIAGVVGWGLILSQVFVKLANELCISPYLKGFRHVVQAELESFLVDSNFNANIAAVTLQNLLYELLNNADQLVEVTRFAIRHPHQMIVVDHMATSIMMGGGPTSCALHIRELARRENLVCKVSGLVTDADCTTWKVEVLKPYCDIVLDSLGASFLMAGTDDSRYKLLATAFADVRRSKVGPLRFRERKNNKILGKVADRIYRIDVAPLKKGGSA